jgi:hypothetical protein
LIFLENTTEKINLQKYHTNNQVKAPVNHPTMFYAPESRYAGDFDAYERLVRGTSEARGGQLAKMDTFYAGLREQEREFEEGLQFKKGELIESIRQFDETLAFQYEKLGTEAALVGSGQEHQELMDWLGIGFEAANILL